MVSGCTACSTPASNAGGDSGTDAPVTVRPSDAGRSVGLDGGAPEDAAGYNFDGNVPDGHVNPFGVGRWDPVPGLNCGILLAADPNVSVPSFSWTPCRSGRPGCQRFDVNWPAPIQGKMGFMLWEAVRLVNGQPLMLDGRIYSNSPYAPQASVFVVETLSGNRLFAMGQFIDAQTSCFGVETVGDRGLALALIHGILPNIEYFMLSSSWASPNALSFRRHALADFGLDLTKGVIQQGAIGKGRMFLELKNPASIAIYDPDQDLFVPTSPTLLGENPLAVSDGALAFAFNTSFGVNLVRPDGSWAEVLLPTGPPPRRISSFGIDRSNAQQLAWVESDYGFSWSNSVIWTSAYATSHAGLQPRKIAVLSDVRGAGGLYMVVNAGVALNLVDKNKALLTRLSDGMGWSITAEPGDAFTLPLWADDSEVWLAIGDATDPSWQASFTGMARFARASLGAPSVPPGL
jgi:hypothetical protein